MAELFGIDKSGISRHLSNIFKSGELDEKVVVAKIATTTQHGAIEGKTQSSLTNYYNLDAIISVGYRVDSKQATQFRIWATNVLKEYMRKGFAMDDERLKQGKTLFGKDYFRELLERVRSIRASERRIWQQITDIFAECSIDYDKTSEVTYKFYATVQNKFHFAITGKTAAEIVYDTADHTKDNMGLTTWENAPDGRILKSDSINAFLEFRRYDILRDNGKVSHRKALEKAYHEYEIFNKTQPIESDFDKVVKEIENKR